VDHVQKHYLKMQEALQPLKQKAMAVQSFFWPNYLISISGWNIRRKYLLVDEPNQV
jgi:hypothetical protein